MQNRLGRTVTPKSERLNRLDYELMVSKVKNFDYLYLVNSDLRLKVCVMIDEDGRSYATCQVGRQALRCGGGYSPSGAVFLLQTAAKVAFASLTEAEKAAVRLENPVGEAPVQNAVAPRAVAASLGNLITPKQLGMIRRIVSEANIDAANECWKLYNCSISELSKQGAADLIDHLQKLSRSLVATV